MMLMSTAASFAVEFSFAPVAKVAEASNAFYAYTESGEAVGISAYEYMQIKDADGYFILNVDGKKVVAAGDEFTVEELIADSVGVAKGCPRVYFSNGTVRTFMKREWGKLIKGQVVRHIAINIPTWEFENYATVGEEIVENHDPDLYIKKLSGRAPAFPAPAATPAPASEPKATPRKINFSIVKK